MSNEKLDNLADKLFKKVDSILSQEMSETLGELLEVERELTLREECPY